MNDVHGPSRAPVNAIDGRVAEDLVGEAWPPVHPGEDATLYGHVVLEPRDPVEVRSLQTFRLHYTVGRYGLDDTGAIKVVFRAMGEGEPRQTSDAEFIGIASGSSISTSPGTGRISTRPAAKRTIFRSTRRSGPATGP